MTLYKYQWFETSASTNKSVLYILNYLNSQGVEPQYIKISTCSFGDTIYYYNNSAIFIPRPSID